MREKITTALHFTAHAVATLLVLFGYVLHRLALTLEKWLAFAWPFLVALGTAFKKQSKPLQIGLSLCVLLLAAAGIATLTGETSYATVTQCEKDACGFWVFHGKTGEGRWKNGRQSTLKIEYFNSYFVTVTSTYANGPQTGLVVRYQGNRHHNHMDGTYTSVWPGHTALPAGTWAADIDTQNADEAWMRATQAAASGNAFDRLHWLMAGAQLGDRRAQNDLGLVYANGTGVPVSYDIAQSLFRKAAGQGSKEAAANLGHIYALGLGVPKDPAVAAGWYKQAGTPPELAALGVPGGFSKTGRAATTPPYYPKDANDAINHLVDDMSAIGAKRTAEEEARCQKSPECMERRERDYENAQAQKERDEELQQWNINNWHFRLR